MNIYLVGGAVRDQLLGREVHDRDYVVVGSSHEEMISLGFTQVGAAFPVYLHPKTKEEYALARTDRRVANGHKGFETYFGKEVTLEQDLARRDLTINAMAKNLTTGEIIDPYNGLSDLQNKLLRATTEAFEEDPLRILRLFRFQSQLGADWRIDYKTMGMAYHNIDRLAEIPAERKWKEFEKALRSPAPQLFIREMCKMGQLPLVTQLIGVRQREDYHPEGNAFVHTLLVVEAAANHLLSPQQVFAAMCHDLGKYPCMVKYGNLHGHEAAGVPLVEQLCDEWKVPNDYRKMALTVTEYHGRIHGSMEMKAPKVYDLIKKLGGEKDDGFFDKVIDCAIMDAWGRGPTRYRSDYPQAGFLRHVAYVLKANKPQLTEKAKEISSLYAGDGVKIGNLIKSEKVKVVRYAMNKERTK